MEKDKELSPATTVSPLSAATTSTLSPLSASEKDDMEPKGGGKDEKQVVAQEEEKQVVAPSEEKEVFSPSSDADKEAFSRTDDSSKEAVSAAAAATADADTGKIFVPQPPPISMDKEVAVPRGDADTEKFPLLSRSTTSSTTTAPMKPLHAGFRFEKKHNLGLIWYLNQQIAARAVDIATGTIGPAAFVTSSMSWTEVMMALPPMFHLYTPGTQFQVARFLPSGIQGLTGMKGTIECVKPGAPNGELEMWQIKRRGIVIGGRQFELSRSDGGDEVKGLVWKGSTKTVKEVYQEGGAKANTKHGSLKLVNERDGEVLAIWNQWRDSEVLGDLMVFGGVVGRVSVEVVVSSALVVIHAERATGLNWIGGLGK